MIHIKFKNLEKSELVKNTALERIEAIVDKFGDLKNCKIEVTLQMDNSPTQAGPDLFGVKLHVSQGRYKGIIVEKSNSNLYVALAEVVDNMLEVLNRFGDRARVKDRKMAREFANNIEPEINLKLG